jgi:hypothetical protein
MKIVHFTSLQPAFEAIFDETKDLKAHEQQNADFRELCVLLRSLLDVHETSDTLYDMYGWVEYLLENLDAMIDVIEERKQVDRLVEAIEALLSPMKHKHTQFTSRAFPSLVDKASSLAHVGNTGRGSAAEGERKQTRIKKQLALQIERRKARIITDGKMDQISTVVLKMKGRRRKQQEHDDDPTPGKAVDESASQPQKKSFKNVSFILEQILYETGGVMNFFSYFKRKKKVFIGDEVETAYYHYVKNQRDMKSNHTKGSVIVCAGYIVSGAQILVASWFTVTYALQYGKHESRRWLSEFFAVFGYDLGVISPMNAFIAGMILKPLIEFVIRPMGQKLLKNPRVKSFLSKLKLLKFAETFFYSSPYSTEEGSGSGAKTSTSKVAPYRDDSISKRGHIG